MPTRHGMAQVWFTILLLVMVVSDGVERRNMAMIGIIAVIGLFGATKQNRR